MSGFIPVYVDTECTTDEPNIYKNPAQYPDRLNQRVRDMCTQAKVPNANMQEIVEWGFWFNGKSKSNLFSARVNPTLYPFFTQLTKITQDMLAGKPTFSEGFSTMCKELSDIGVDVNDPKFLAVGCGDFDFKYPLTAHVLNDSLDLPVFFQRVCNIKVVFEKMLSENKDLADKHAAFLAAAGKKARLDMASMLHTLDLTLDGTHHRADDDAANVAKIGTWLLQKGYVFEPTFSIKVSGRVD